MTKELTTMSQLTLVADRDLSGEGKKLPQYAAALSAALGALAFGGVLSWSAAAGDEGLLLSEEYKFPITVEQFSWIGSIPNISCAAMCLPIGILMDVVGRRASMLMLVVPFSIGWGLIIFSNSVMMFILGRFLLGLCGGALCAAIPIYTAEIGEINIRGRLGSFLDLMLSSGILISYTLSSFTTIRQLSIILSIIPLIFFGIFFFMPETPVYYLMKNDENRARESLVRLRGTKYNIEEELEIKKNALLDEIRNNGSFFKAIKTKASRNGIIIAYGLMFFQQLSGLSAIIYYTATIFGSGGLLSQEVSMIIAGSLQVFSDALSSFLVDKLGRRVLLISSISVMTICTFTLGTYFYMEDKKFDVSTVSWIPLISVSLFLVMCSFGFGPIPWMMMGELFSPNVKGIAGSSACCFNWIMAFVVTRFYNSFVIALGIYTPFWVFSGVSFFGILFVIFVVPETKGKSLEQIQLELGAKSASMEICT